MVKTAFVFPGQGSQEPGMLDPFREAWPTVTERLDAVDDGHLQSLLSEADAETLRDPANTQQAVLATGVVVQRELRDRFDIEPDIVAGHSLGHISAATAAGALSLPDAVDLVKRRGELMAMAEAEAGPGTMIAVSLAAPDDVADIVASFDGVTVAGYNSSKQTVISGERSAVTAAADAIEQELPRARSTELEVGSAFHSPVMDPATEPFGTALAETTFANPSTLLVSDVTGERYADPAQLQTDLEAQLTAPIRWISVVETLVERGVERVVELPPAGTLTTLTERITTELEVTPLASPADIETLQNHG